jgi:hypothetical protein
LGASDASAADIGSAAGLGADCLAGSYLTVAAATAVALAAYAI